MGIRLFLVLLISAPSLAGADTGCFEVTDDALKLARQLSVVKDELAFGGGVTVDPSRPYGAASSVTEVESARRNALRAFQILLRFAELNPGSYRTREGSVVTVTPEQLKLQRHFNFVDGIERGTTGIDPKRPYGDSECWELDMADALGEEPLGDEDTACEESFTPEQRQRFHSLHASMLGFVRALLAHGTLKLRRYRADKEMIGIWERCE